MQTWDGQTAGTLAMDGLACPAMERAMSLACECHCQGVAHEPWQVWVGRERASSVLAWAHDVSITACFQRCEHWKQAETAQAHVLCLQSSTRAASVMPAAAVTCQPTPAHHLITHNVLVVPVHLSAACCCCSFLDGRGLAGSIPSDPGLWAGLTGLTNIDLGNNQLSGSVPAAIKSAPLLTSV